MKVPRLPQEIVNGILEHLEGDPSALQQCALVSHSFCPTAQRFLFASIDMDASDRGVHKSERLMNALKTAPGLFGHVNYLNLLLGLLTDPEPTMTILKSLPHLSSLSLNQTFPHGNDSRLITALIACIQQAHLRRVSINGIIDFPLHIFTAAPYLRHLSIKEFRTSDTIITNIVVPSAPAREPGYLESLSCSEGQRDSDSTRALISNLTQPASILRLTRLKRFTGGLHSKSDCQAIQKLIVLAGSSLEELSLSIRFKEAPVIDIAAVSKLKQVFLTIFEDVHAPRWILDFLLTLPTPCSLQYITLTALYSSFDNIAWQKIDTSLSTEPQFLGVRTVTLRYFRNEGRYRLPESAFPCCAARGTLVVFCESDQVFPIPWR